MKVNNRVFGYFHRSPPALRLSTYNDDEVWTNYSIKDDDDLAKVKPIASDAMERRAK